MLGLLTAVVLLGSAAGLKVTVVELLLQEEGGAGPGEWLNVNFTTEFLFVFPLPPAGSSTQLPTVRGQTGILLFIEIFSSIGKYPRLRLFGGSSGRFCEPLLPAQLLRYPIVSGQAGDRGRGGGGGSDVQRTVWWGGGGVAAAREDRPPRPPLS